MHPDIADSLHQIASIHRIQQHTTKALPLYQQALTMREKALGSHHKKTKATRAAYTNLLRELGRVQEAMAIENQIVETLP